MTKQELLDYCLKHAERSAKQQQQLDTISRYLFYGKSLAYKDIAEILDEDLYPEKYALKWRIE